MYRLSVMLLFIASISFSQNLVLNPSFEDGAECDNSSAETGQADDWTALMGSPRFLNPTCPLSRDQQTYVKGMKMPNALEGKVFVGMGIDKEGEYLQGKLKEPLKKSTRYIITLRIRLPVRFCNTALDELGIVLTDSTIKPQQDYGTISLPSLKLTPDDGSLISEQYKWQELTALYEGTGKEDKIIIGNFADNNIENFKKREGRQCSYVYIDMVSVKKYEPITVKPYNNNSSFKVGNRFILKDVAFETGLEKLKNSSFKQLEGLTKRLIADPELRLEISGHTDNTGEEAVNLIFSKSRAKAVMDFLVSKGALDNQVLIVGKGSADNIALNNNENNRAKNRRIEIKVLAVGSPVQEKSPPKKAKHKGKDK